jgi:hypothetical protein
VHERSVLSMLGPSATDQAPGRQGLTGSHPFAYCSATLLCQKTTHGRIGRHGLSLREKETHQWRLAT